MSSKKPRVLIVDDDPGVRKLVEYNLSLEGYEVITANGGKEALRRAQNETPDLVLLDVIMPDLNGLRVCQSLRSISQVPIVMLTGKAEEESVLKGFGLGADDYVTKPFNSDELIARVKAVLRRSRFPEEMPRPPLVYNDLTIDFESRRVIMNDEEISLTATEYKLLALLFTNIGRVLTHDYLLSRIWGEEYKGESHLLQVAMSRLRNKLGANRKGTKLIGTKVGIGYIVSKQT
jgi:two-component system KDP operon response regulator KdpE